MYKKTLFLHKTVSYVTFLIVLAFIKKGSKGLDFIQKIYI